LLVITAEALLPPRRSFAERLTSWLVWGGVAVLLAVSLRAVDIDRLPLLFSNSGNMAEFGRDFVRPDFTQWRLYVAEMLETVQMALWGTFLAVLFAVPFGLLSARNIAPGWIGQPIRRLMDVLRSVNELVIAILFVTAVGLGPLPGVLALALHTTGVLAKLFSEAVESIDPRPVEGVRAVGASRVEEIVWGVLPQVAPLWTSFALYRFEANSRSATVLGLIGAGGIGQLLVESLQGFEYGQASAITLIIVLAVSAIDLLSQLIRKRLL
jgi:phosphonate transport system permease protein